jgi:hypothetical protein
MNDERIAEELRAALEAAHRPADPGLEDRILQHTFQAGGALPGRPSDRWRGVMVVTASVALAALAVAALTLPRLARSMGRPTPVPAGTPAAPTAREPSLVYRQGIGSPYVRVNWNGHVLGQVVPPPGTMHVTMSPDGSVGLADGANALFAPNGEVLAHLPDGANSANLVIADDSVHYCWLDQRMGSLVYGTVRGSAVTVPIRGETRSLVQAFAVGCSARMSRAVIASPTSCAATCFALASGAAFLSVVDLNSGQVTYQHDYQATPLVSVLKVSPDARYVSESGATSSTQVRDLTTGAVLATLQGVGLGFSGDDSRLVLDVHNSGEGPGSFVAEVVRWQNGQVIWRAGGLAPVTVRTHPAAAISL